MATLSVCVCVGGGGGGWKGVKRLMLSLENQVTNLREAEIYDTDIDCSSYLENNKVILKITHLEIGICGINYLKLHYMKTKK